MAWTGKDTNFAFALASSATAWGTAATIGAGAGIKMNKVPLDWGIPEVKAEETTDAAWASILDQGNVKPIEMSIEVNPRYCSSTSIDPVSQLLMAVCYNATTVATPAGGTNSRLHTGTIASSHAFADDNSRFGTPAFRLKTGTGYAYVEAESYLPTGFEWTSDASDSSVKLAIKGIADRILTDATTPAATNTGTPWGNMTYLDDSRLVHQKHIGATGCWFAKSAAEGGSPVTFGTGQAIKPSKLSIKFDRKKEGFHTVTAYTDAPVDNGFATGEVSMEFPKVLDAHWTGTDNLISAAKDYENTGVEVAYHLRVRYQFPTVIEGSLYPYIEFGLPRLALKDLKTEVTAGKVIPLSATFQVLRPNAASHLPTPFQYVGGTSGTAFDALYIAIQNQTTTAYIA